MLRDLDDFVWELQEILYHVEEHTFGGRWDPEKPWDAEVLAQLADLMDAYGLVPKRGEGK